MKWFKHDSNANMDAKVQEVLLDYGLEGYGLYWYCLELIAAKIEPGSINFELEHDARIIARNTGCTVQKVEEMMKSFIALGLFESSDGVVTCFKLASRTDEYTAKLIRSEGKKSKPSEQTPITIGTNSGQTPDNVGTPSGQTPVVVGIKSEKIPPNRIDKKRIEENKDTIYSFEEFYQDYNYKKGKKDAEKAYSKVKEADRVLIKANIPTYVASTPDLKWRSHPSTYLNGEKWNDEITALIPDFNLGMSR